MKRVRIGNDLPIEWCIFRGGEPEDLTSRKTVVKLLDERMKPCPIDFSIEGNMVSGVFEGRRQERAGFYSLVLVENPDEPSMNTFDVCNAFELVLHSCQEGGGDPQGLTLTPVRFTSDLTVPANGVDGDSAFVIAQKNGFVGTEQEWLRSLVGKSAYEIAVDNGFEGTEAEFVDSLQRGLTIVKDEENDRKYNLVDKNGNVYGSVVCEDTHVVKAVYDEETNSVIFSYNEESGKEPFSLPFDFNIKSDISFKDVGLEIVDDDEVLMSLTR